MRKFLVEIFINHNKLTEFYGKLANFNDQFDALKHLIHNSNSNLFSLYLFQAAIRKELNEFKSLEMAVHDESRHMIRYWTEYGQIEAQFYALVSFPLTFEFIINTVFAYMIRYFV